MRETTLQVDWWTSLRAGHCGQRAGAGEGGSRSHGVNTGEDDANQGSAQ